MQLTALRKKAEGSAPPERKPGRRLTVRRGAALLLVLALAAGAALGGKALFFSGEEQTPLTEQTTYGSLSTTLSGTGTTMPADSVTYTTASEAEITGVYVSAGDTVEVGELLYTQDDSELDDQIEEYQDQITEQENQLDDYQEQLAQLQEEIAALTVKAPFAGRITDVAVDMGDNMAAGTKLATLVDDSQMCLTQYFSYAYEDQVYVGMKAGVSVASLMLNQEGTVTDIQMVDRVTAEGTHCFAVTVTLDNPGAFTEGMTGAGYLVADSGEKLYPSVDGELEYRRSQDLTAEVGGEVTGIGAVDYEQVSAGAVLVQLDGADYQKQVESVNKQITQTQEKIVQLQEKSAETEEKRSDYAVTAELAGKIIMVNVREGESPREAGQTAVVLYNLDSMTITANIDELDIDGIAMGMEVDITQSGAESDTHYTGTVTEISYEATNSNGVAYFPITITIPSGGALSAGVNVSYSITVGDESEGVLAPSRPSRAPAREPASSSRRTRRRTTRWSWRTAWCPTGSMPCRWKPGCPTASMCASSPAWRRGWRYSPATSRRPRTAGIPPARERSRPTSRAAGKCRTSAAERCRISAAECLAAWAAGCPAAALWAEKGDSV